MSMVDRGVQVKEVKLNDRRSVYHIDLASRKRIDLGSGVTTGNSQHVEEW
jgi:hypothetical protein